MNFEELAVFGSKPAFSRKLHVGCPNVGDRERLLWRINDLLERRWLTNNGIFVQEFEQKLADFLAVKHCVTTCNATIALILTIRALELTGEVILPAFTFIATAHALRWQGITPVFCDLHPETHAINPAEVEALITPQTTGIIGVHIWGQPCDVKGLSAIAQAHKLKLMFDAAQAFGSTYQGKMLGNFGSAEVFSFHATKVINTFEGGVIATNDDALAHKLRLMINFGFVGVDQVIELGINGKMSEVAAAMGLTSLESFEGFVAVNHRNYQQYQQELADIPGVLVFKYNGAERLNYQYVVVEIEESVTKISRDDIIKILQAENIIARRYFYPGCHRLSPYSVDFPNVSSRLVQTERLCQRVLVLPTGTSISPEDISKICQIIRLVSAQGALTSKYLLNKEGKS